MPTNLLQQACHNWGVNPVNARAVLRELSSDMIAAGPGTTVGVHDFGVLYVQRNQKRFVVRAGTVYEISERDVLKLRPSKAVPSALTESADVRINQDLDFGSGAVAWQFKSTSRANRFEVVLPTAHAGNDFDFVRDDELGVQTYVLAKNTLSDVDLQNVQGINHNVTTKEILAIRYTRDLRSVTTQAAGAPHVDVGNLAVSANVQALGLKAITDPVYGSEALAWLRQRAIALADR